jgi:hypothetical protein
MSSMMQKGRYMLTVSVYTAYDRRLSRTIFKHSYISALVSIHYQTDVRKPIAKEDLHPLRSA